MPEFYDCADAQARRAGIDSAAHALGSGQLVVLPTDTVYGVGADAFDRDAVAALLQAKGRGRDMPVPVLVGSWATLDGLVGAVPPAARDLIEAFWPGGLTLVVRHASTLAWDLGDADGTVAVRMPLHPVAIQLLERTGPLAVSSANRSGQPPAQTAEQAREQLGDAVSVYLEAGSVVVDGAGGTASTIVEVTAHPPRVLRVGALSVDELRAVVPDIVEPRTAAEQAD